MADITALQRAYLQKIYKEGIAALAFTFVRGWENLCDDRGEITIPEDILANLGHMALLGHWLIMGVSGVQLATVIVRNETLHAKLLRVFPSMTTTVGHDPVAIMEKLLAVLIEELPKPPEVEVQLPLTLPAVGAS